MLREVELGNKALEFMKTELANGNTFAAFILKRFKLENGKVITFLPEDVDAGNITDFSDSVADNYQRMCGETHDKINNFVLAYLSQERNNVAIFEDHFSPDADYIQEERVQFFSCGQEVYRYLTSSDLNEAKIAHTVGGARGYPFIAALTSFPDSETIQVHAAVSDDYLQRLTAEIDYLIIGAFDQDGFLIWTIDKYPRRREGR